MKFQVDTAVRTVKGAPQNVYLLSSPDQICQAEIWPEFGCNCLRWRVSGPQGPLELLYAVPDFETNPAPNRSGIPVLFPFPNRIRGGHFIWHGREYRLPLNDPAGKNSIHGFVCRRPWRVLSSSASENIATLTAEFQGSIDSPQDAALWPGDYKLTLRFLLGPDSLSLSATMTNPGLKTIPLGLGFHPFFKLPLAATESANECQVCVPADTIWGLRENIPTGDKLPVDHFRDLRTPRKFADLLLDDVYTNLRSASPNEKLHLRGRIEQNGVGAVEVWSTAAFRELVVFTPPTRAAVCLEPYTCATDAINLHLRGIDAGLIELAPGESRTEFVVFRYVREASA
jgi:aldose 1-epimerase